MIRVLLFLLVLVGLVFGLAWLVDRPGEITLVWQGQRITTSLLVGLGLFLSVVALVVIGWSLLRLLLGLPTTLSLSSRARRRERGYAAVSRGMIAVGSGDAQAAKLAAVEAQRLLRDEPLALLLRAQAAQLANDRERAEAAFKQMADRKDTRLLGLRGLHAEAQRRGDAEQALQIASRAHRIAALPWTAQAVLEHRTATADWEKALAALQAESGAKHLDRKTRDRQIAVLETAIGLEKEQSAPDAALRMGRSALKHEPDFVPALALTVRILARKGGARKAMKLIEKAWPVAPHPDLAKLYVDLRPTESGTDRLTRAQTLMRLAPGAAESRLAVARAAIDAGAYKIAREALLPLVDGPERPTTRVCVAMADLERAEHGSSGYVTEWLTRASKAPRDPAWVADGIVSDHWLPASPVTGKLDAFIWQRPVEHLALASEPEEAIFAPVPQALAAPVDEKAEPEILVPEPEPEKAQDMSDSATLATDTPVLGTGRQ
jgi:HemY protein